MDINRYRYIAVLARTKSFTRASEELHISQPALTKAIRKTEEEVGVPLFDRHASPLQLTFAGELFLKEAIKILNIQDTLEKEMTRIASGGKGRLVMGVPAESAARWLPKILPDFVAQHPDTEIAIVEGSSDTFEKGLLEGTIDLCIYNLPVFSNELEYEILEERPIFLVSSDRHPFAADVHLASNGPCTPFFLEPRRLEGERFLTLTHDKGMYRVVMQILERHGVKVNIVLQLTNNYTISRLAASGFGLCFTTYSAGERLKMSNDLSPVFYTIDDPVFIRKTIIAYRTGDCLSPAARAMLDLARIKIAGAPKPKVTINYGKRDAS